MITIIKRTREEADKYLTDKAEKELAEVKRKTKKVKLSEYEVLDLIHDATRKDRLGHVRELEKLKREVTYLEREVKELNSLTIWDYIFGRDEKTI